MKKIALINDLSGFGKCSLTAAIPVISVLGIQACPLPTAIVRADRILKLLLRRLHRPHELFYRRVEKDAGNL